MTPLPPESIADKKLLAKAWYQQWLLRLWRNLFLKTVGITAFIWLFFIAYFWLLRHPQFPVLEMPLTVVDDWIPVQAWTLGIYLSLWFYVTIPPSLMLDRRTLYRYGVAAGLLCLSGLAFFFFWPNAVPAGLLGEVDHPGMSLLKGIDAAGNAFPSLHVATAVFSAIWLAHFLKVMRASTLVRSLNWIWCFGIAYSTMATKQHVFVDVLGGTALGALAAWLSVVWFRRCDDLPR